MELAVDRLGRGAAGLEAVGKDIVRVEVKFLLAILGTDVDVQAAVGARQLDAVLAQVASDGGISDVLVAVEP